MEQAFRHCVHEARDAGQTVFRSSHILSEVEALCDRVGILLGAWPRRTSAVVYGYIAGLGVAGAVVGGIFLNRRDLLGA
jgi:ABC-type uncharacterized transport system ATPase subunit